MLHKCNDRMCNSNLNSYSGSLCTRQTQRKKTLHVNYLFLNGSFDCCLSAAYRAYTLIHMHIWCVSFVWYPNKLNADQTTKTHDWLCVWSGFLEFSSKNKLTSNQMHLCFSAPLSHFPGPCSMFNIHRVSNARYTLNALFDDQINACMHIFLPRKLLSNSLSFHSHCESSKRV